MQSPFFIQTWTASTVLINIMVQGMIINYPSCMLPDLQKPDSTMPIDLNTSSWLASISSFTAMVGIIISLMLEPFGRPASLALINLPGVLSWLFIFFATNVKDLLIGRALVGVTVAASAIIGATSIGEYTDPNIRGAFLHLKSTTTTIGFTLVHVLGNYFSWRTIALFCFTIHAISLCTICTWYESPVWLIKNNKFGKAQTNFFIIRGNTRSSRDELSDMMSAQKERNAINGVKKNCMADMLTTKIFKTSYLFPIIMVNVGFIMSISSGRNALCIYTKDFLGGMVKDKSYFFTITIIIDTILVVSSLASSFAILHFERRWLLFTSCIPACTFLVTISLLLYLMSKDIISKHYSEIVILLLFAYFFLINFACIPTAFALPAELFPLEYKAPSLTLCWLFLALFTSINLKLTPHMLVAFHVYGTFLTFAIILAAALAFLYMYLPETKGKTLQEIEDHFTKRKCNRKEETHEASELKMIIKQQQNDKK